MSDPIPTEHRAGPDEGVDRHARIEDLLITGLDHYFRGEYDDAIHIWTRVLFLDRGHTRARAYIERARGAAAERQRESEELLHGGVAAFDRGDVHVARRLLSSAVERGGPHDVALALLDRLDLLSEQPGQEQKRPHGAVRARGVLLGRRPIARGHESESRARPSFWLLPLALVAIGIVATVVLSLQNGPTTSFPWPRTNAPTAAVIEEPLPIISPGEAAVGRARALIAQGRLHDALRVLENVRRGDAVRADADALRASVQRAILAGDAKAPPR